MEGAHLYWTFPSCPAASGKDGRGESQRREDVSCNFPRAHQMQLEGTSRIIDKRKVVNLVAVYFSNMPLLRDSIFDPHRESIKIPVTLKHIYTVFFK